MTPMQWAYGALAAVIGAAANGVIVVVVNPGTFDIFSVPGWKNISTTCGASALVALAAYLKQSPLPEVRSASITITTKSTTQDEEKK